MSRSRPLTGFAPIPAGWFVMGSAAGQPDEAPVHRVWVDAFELADRHFRGAVD